MKSIDPQGCRIQKNLKYAPSSYHKFTSFLSFSKNSRRDMNNNNNKLVINKWFSQIFETNQQNYELPSMFIGHLRWHIRSRLLQFHCLPLKLNRISRTIVTIIIDMVFIDCINYYQFVCLIQNITSLYLFQCD